MDASALLLRQGWRGTGHSLDTSNRGITKPLLITYKQDQLGLGKRRAAQATDDQWWMRAFDESLQNIGTGKGSTLSEVRTKGVNRGGLYGFFVKGEGLRGTVGVALETGGKRKRGDEGGNGKVKKVKKAKVDDLKTTTKMHTQTLQTPLGHLTPDQRSKIASFLTRMDTSLRKTIKANEKAGLYGSYSSSSSSTSTPPTEAPTSAKRARKAAKKACKQALQNALDGLRKQEIVEAMLDGETLPNPQRWGTREEVLKHWDEISRTMDLVALKNGGEHCETATPVPTSTASIGTTPTTTTAKSTAAQTPTVQIPPSEPPKSSKKDKQGKAGQKGQGITNLAVAAKLAKLTAQERSAYEARAREKGQSLEDYVRRRIVKRELKNRGK